MSIFSWVKLWIDFLGKKIIFFSSQNHSTKCKKSN
jgi:hypothetical protein